MNNFSKEIEMENLESLVGKIFSCRWGWEQTNYDYYKVIKASGKFITLQQMDFRVVDDYRENMAYTSAPCDIDTSKKPIRRKVSFYGDKPWVKINSYSCATLWNGEENYCTYYD